MASEKYPIFLLSFPDQHLLASTFLRFQEYYESPRFRGRTFTWEEYMDWYARTNGKFSYLQDWSGFNIPDRVLRPFYDGSFDPLTRKERALLELFRDVPPPFYVIGVVDGKKLDDSLHELVHGLFAVFPDYRRDVIGCLRRFDLSSAKKILLEMGYARNVLDDELNAYITTGLSDRLKAKERRLGPVKRALLDVFTRHFGCSIGDRRNWRRLLRKTRRIRLRPRMFG